MQRVTFHIPIRTATGALQPFALLREIRETLIHKFGGLTVIPDVNDWCSVGVSILHNSVELYIVDTADQVVAPWVHEKAVEWRLALQQSPLYVTIQEVTIL